MFNYLDNGAKSGVYAGFYAGIALSIYASILVLLVTLATKNETFGLGYTPMLVLIPSIPIILIASILIWTVIGTIAGFAVWQWRIRDRLPQYSTYAVIIVCGIAIAIHLYLIATGDQVISLVRHRFQKVYGAFIVASVSKLDKGDFYN